MLHQSEKSPLSSLNDSIITIDLCTPEFFVFSTSQVDVWDGDSGPVIKHGYAMTSELLFKEVVEVTNTYAFDKSE